MNDRPDFSQAVRQLVAVKQQEGNTNPYIPKHLRNRQRPSEEKKRLERQWKSWGWNHGSQSSSSSSSSSSTWWRPQEWQEPQGWQGWQEWQE